MKERYTPFPPNLRLPSEGRRALQRLPTPRLYVLNFQTPAGPRFGRSFFAQMIEKLLVEVISLLVGVVIVDELDYYVSTLSEKGP